MSETRCFDLDHVVSIRVKLMRAGEWITVDRRDGFDGTKWAVSFRGSVLDKKGEWEYEPQPSSRTNAFKKRCRWVSFDEAYDAAWNCSLVVENTQATGSASGLSQT